MPVYVNLKKIFIHIPRTGGTSINEYFKSKNEPVNAIYSNFKHYTYNDYKIISDIENYEMFTVVRNPYTRIVSYFNYHMATDNNVIQSFNMPINRQNINEIFHLYLKSNLTEIPCKYERETPLLVYKPQFSYINSNVTILKFETMNSDFNTYMGITCELPRITSIPINYSRYDAHDLLDDTSIKLINQYYMKDFIQFNYDIL